MGGIGMFLCREYSKFLQDKARQTEYKFGGDGRNIITLRVKMQLIDLANGSCKSSCFSSILFTTHCRTMHPNPVGRKESSTRSPPSSKRITAWTSSYLWKHCDGRNGKDLYRRDRRLSECGRACTVFRKIFSS